MNPAVASIFGIVDNACGCVNISEIWLSVLWGMNLFKRVLLHPVEEVHFRACIVLQNS